jgi:Rrf2 family protein
MVQLARHYDGQTLTRLDDIAQREAVSANFLVQILNDLKRGYLIISKRGKTGGYLLASDPREISLLQVTQAVEPGMLTPNISNDGESGRAINQAWDQVNQSLVKELGSITMDTLCTQSPMFYI